MRQVWTQLLPAVVLGATVVACGGDDGANSPQAGAAAPPPAAREAVAGTAGAATATDFVRTQLTFGDKQIGLARVASERATRPAVKELGAAIVRDHQTAIDSLRQMASQQGVTTSTSPEQLDVERERLSQLSGAAFEREYLDEIIADHERAITDLETANTGGDATLRQWATTTLPVLRRHLERARELRKSDS